MSFISSFVRRKLGQVLVRVTPTEIIIEGISRDALEHDMSRMWSTSTLAKYMFLSSNFSTVRIPMFFALDMFYVFTTLYESNRTRTPKYTLNTIINKLKEDTWLGRIEHMEPERINVSSQLKNFAIHKPKDYQEAFIKHYMTVTKALNLKGYMLDSKPGTGKTLSLLYLSHCLNETGKKIFVVPKNSVHRVWEHTINDLLIEDSPWWSSLSNKPLNNDYKFYIVHYEYLEHFIDWFDRSDIRESNIFVGLDESHNFNRLSASRTQAFLRLCGDNRIGNVVWSSGTPISALGSECIPFLKCIDPYFTARSENAFAKIYGRNAKRANDILRHRIGHLKFFVPSQEAGIVNTNIIEYSITMPGSDKYTMDQIRKELTDYIDDRMKYYKTNYGIYKGYYDKGIETFKMSRDYLRYEQDFKQYLKYFKTIQAGYEPSLHKEIAKFVNDFELKTIFPTLPRPLNHQFKGARSVMKYVHLKVMGEALGLLSRYRSRCFKEMVPHSHLPELIDGAAKKTIIFSSYVDVVKEVGDYLEGEGYTPTLIYGDTNKNLAVLVKEFFNDPKVNPLVATFQSLSTAVPLIAANRIINMNQPFRDNIKQQSIARAARLGQDKDVDVYDVLLDTKGVENISTRNQDILEWSAEMVKSIMGTSNLDLGDLAMEMDDPFSESVAEDRPSDIDAPYVLYGYAYKGQIVASADKDIALKAFISRDKDSSTVVKEINTNNQSLTIREGYRNDFIVTRFKVIKPEEGRWSLTYVVDEYSDTPHLAYWTINDGGTIDDLECKELETIHFLEIFKGWAIHED